MHHRFNVQQSEQNHFYGDNYQDEEKKHTTRQTKIVRYEQNVSAAMCATAYSRITWHLTHFEWKKVNDKTLFHSRRKFFFYFSFVCQYETFFLVNSFYSE